jgi:hypothetical protein
MSPINKIFDMVIESLAPSVRILSSNSRNHWQNLVMQFRLVHTLTILVVSLSACGKVAPTPFSRDPSIPVGLPPNPSAELGQNPPDTSDPTQPPVLPSSQYCAPVHNQYNEEVFLEKGRSSRSQTHSWGRGGGCVMRPIDEVWSTMFNHELVKWNGVSEIEVTPMPQVGSSSYHYEIALSG